MKKSVITLALASAMGMASSAHSADFRIDDSTRFSVYGTIELFYSSEKDANGDSRSAFDDGGSTIGFKGSHAFRDNAVGFFKAEFEHRADEEKELGGLNEGDQAYVGMKGESWGQIRAGSWDVIYQEEIYDRIDSAEIAEPTKESDSGEGDTIAYFSPKFGDLDFQVAARLRGERDTGAADAETGFAVVGRWHPGNLKLHVAYDDRGAENDVLDDGTVVFDEGSTLGVVAEYDFGPLVLAARWARVANFTDTQDTDFLAALIEYDYGGGSIYAVPQRIDPDGGDSRTEITAGINHFLAGSDNWFVYAEYGAFDQPNDEDDVFAVGTVYEF